MLRIRFICVGKMKEKFYTDAFSEYVKRLGAYCKFECFEIQEQRLQDNPGQNEINAALNAEENEILKKIPSSSYVIAMCIEGLPKSSEEFSKLISGCANRGVSCICFLIGGSFGLSEGLKSKADCKLSMSEMTFPHHLARVMLAEQVYRAFKIEEGSRYHK